MIHNYNAGSPVSLFFLIVIFFSYSNAFNNRITSKDMNISATPSHRKTRFQRDVDDDDYNDENLRDPGPLVKYGKFCKELPIEIIGEGIPEQEISPVSYSIYFLDQDTPNTLHIVFKAKDPSFTYDFLVVMAINENGVPIGHFHLIVCRLGAKRTGLWKLNNRCNKGKDPQRKIRHQWGNPHVVYVEQDHNVFGHKIKEQSIFWSWIPKDRGPRPESIQFRFAVVQYGTTRDKIWIGTTTPSIKFRDVWEYIIPKPAEGDEDIDTITEDVDDPEECYINPVKADSPGNFLLSNDNVETDVNEEYLSILFPMWFRLDNLPEKYKRVLRRKLKKDQDHLNLEKSIKNEMSCFMRPPASKLAMKRAKDYAKEIYKGCSRIKSCIGENVACVHNKNCKLLVTYQNMMYQPKYSDYIRFEIVAEFVNDKTHGYAAVGISKDPYMGDDNVIECSSDEGRLAGVYNSWNFKNKTNRRMSKSCLNGIVRTNLKDCRITVKKKMFACTFYLRKFLNPPELEGIHHTRDGLDLETQSFYLQRVVGHQFITDTRPMAKLRVFRPIKDKKRNKRNILKSSKKEPTVSGQIGKHTSAYTTTKPLDLTRIRKASVGSDLKKLGTREPLGELKYIRWHIFFAVTTIIGLVPNGIFVARYFKETWIAAMIFGTSLWRVAHTAYMLLVVSLFGVDLAVMFFGYNQQVQNVAHNTCGFVMYFVLIMLQPILGLILTYLKVNSKFQFTTKVIHWAIGTIMKIFGNIVIALAPRMIQTRLFIGIWVIVFVEFIFNMLMHLIMTVLYHKGDMKIFKDRRHSHGKWNRAFNPLPMAKLHRSMPGERRRLILYLWYQFGTAVLASLIIIPYAGYNNLYVCLDDPLALTKVRCTNKETKQDIGVLFYV